MILFVLLTSCEEGSGFPYEGSKCQAYTEAVFEACSISEELASKQQYDCSCCPYWETHWDIDNVIGCTEERGSCFAAAECIREFGCPIDECEPFRFNPSECSEEQENFYSDFLNINLDIIHDEWPCADTSFRGGVSNNYTSISVCFEGACVPKEEIAKLPLKLCL
jgi:hypothetical protein